MKQYKSIFIQQKSPNSKVFYIYLNIPSKFNAFPLEFFTEFPDAIDSLDQNPDVGVIIVAGVGDHFCAGGDIKLLEYIAQTAYSGEGVRGNEWVRRTARMLQEAFNAVERSRKTVISSIHGYCIGGGIDIVTACDLRYCTKDTIFMMKHIDLGFTDDMGALQRLTPIIGHGNALEMALTCRKVSAQEAKEMGLVSRVFESKQALDEGVALIAEGIAAKSPIVVAGTKIVMLKSKDLTIEQGLEYVGTWNAAAINSSGDMVEAIRALTEKRKPCFAKL
ncbi:Delta(3 5)-Delta(2 4)-dienoyl-CoA isomerase mitochondrial [Euphorbia peplus]|nr:Delta(3 5)-Delta(2 4)-dienoyl-CoA isomerase mitochondrial [Euphorbia peplus]